MTEANESRCYQDLPELEPDALLIGEDVYMPPPKAPKRHKCRPERFWPRLPKEEGGRFQCGKCGQWWQCSNAVIAADTGGVRAVFSEGGIVWQRVPPRGRDLSCRNPNHSHGHPLPPAADALAHGDHLG